jgi:hypothetical protein
VLSYSVNASGTNRLVSGQARLLPANTTDDGFVAVNGATVLQEGFPIVGSGVTSNVATFDSAFMQPDGSWYAVGNFAPVSPATVGGGFVVFNGVLLAKGGDPIVPGSSESWSGSVNTFCTAVLRVPAGDAVSVHRARGSTESRLSVGRTS